MTILGLFPARETGYLLHICSPLPWPHHSTSEYNHPWWYHAVRSVDRSFRNTIAQVLKFNDHPWSPPASPLHYETGCPLLLQLYCLIHSVNGSAVVYLFLRNTKLVFTWCTALHGMMCSRSSFSYARMLLQAIFK